MPVSVADPAPASNAGAMLAQREAAAPRRLTARSRPPAHDDDQDALLTELMLTSGTRIAGIAVRVK
jgi:hypothetical protein